MADKDLRHRMVVRVNNFSASVIGVILPLVQIAAKGPAIF